MRFTSLTALSVLLITFVLAIPAPDKYIHFKDPDCNAVNARACLLVPYCKNHRERGDLFTARGYLKSRGGPEPENLDLNLTDALSPSLPAFLPTKELGFIGRRARSTQCGVLAANSDISDPVGTLVPKVLYDLILDYPYDGATGGKSSLFIFLPTSSSPNLLNLSPQTSRIILIFPFYPQELSASSLRLLLKAWFASYA